MKHFVTLVLLAFALNSAYSQSNVPNGDFENWYNIIVSADLNYDELGTGPTDNWISTLNSLAQVPPSLQGPGPVTVFKTTDKYSGTYAAKGVSALFQLGQIPIFIPGMVGTAVMDFPGIKAFLGKPCTGCKPLRFKGFYKFKPVNGDSCSAVILLSKWNATDKKRDTIGYGKMVQRTAVDTYTQFDVPINYTGTGVVDSMTLLVLSSAGVNLVKFMESKGQIGSTIYVDELTLEYASGIQQVLMPEVAVHIFPNPASDILNIELSKEVKGGSFDIYSAGGKLMGSHLVSTKKSCFPVHNLPNGNYFFRLMEGQSLLNSGSFVINR